MHLTSPRLLARKGRNVTPVVIGPEIPNRKFLFHEVPTARGTFSIEKANIVHFRSVLASHRPVCSLVNEDVSSMNVSVSEPSSAAAVVLCVCNAD